MGKKKVLIVDDNRLMLKTLEMTLRKTYEVITATNKHDAEKKLHKADLLITDLQFPDKEGEPINVNAGNELAKKAHNKKIPVIGMSSEPHKFHKKYFVEVLEKGFDLHDIRAAVNKALGESS